MCPHPESPGGPCLIPLNPQFAQDLLLLPSFPLVDLKKKEGVWENNTPPVSSGAGAAEKTGAQGGIIVIPGFP